MAKTEILQLAVGGVQTQAVSDRRVNIQCLAGNARPFGARHIVHRTHVVATICELDQNHAHIACHGQQHFAKALGLIFFARVEFEFVELREAINQFCDG